MAFSTIQGSGGAPDSFVGTTGVDAIAIANSSGNFFLGGNTGADQITVLNSGSNLYGGVLSSATIKGGAAADTLTIGNANNTIYTGLFTNGGADRDTITVAAGDTVLASTIQGGKANDTINTGILTSSKVNGNKGVDTITLTGAGTAASVFGGGGNDVITDGNVAYTQTLISGDLGNDTVTLGNAGASIDALTVRGGAGVDTITLGNAGVAANDDIFVAGNDGADTITGTSVAVTEVTLSGGAGNDTITVSNGTSTVIGGLGTDTMTAAAQVDMFLYNAQGQGGAGVSATAATALVDGDTINAFNTAGEDLITFDSSETLVGSSATFGTGAANAWNLNTSGVFALTGTTVEYVNATGLAASTIAASVGTVVGDAGDKAYFTVRDTTTATQNLVVGVTLGTTRAVGNGTALNAGDTVELVAVVNAGAILDANDFSFV